MADYILPVKAVVSPVVGSPTPGVACQPIYQVGADGLVRYRDQDGTVLAFPGGVSHSTVLGTCPATGPTVAPTTEGHYYWTSTLGEIWAWEFGAAAPYVTGKFYGTSAATAGWPFTFSVAVPQATVVPIASIALPRTGRIVVSGGGITLVNNIVPTSIAAWLTKNGVQVARDSTTVKPPSVTDRVSNDSGMATTIDVVAGDVVTYLTYVTDSPATASGRIDIQYVA